MPERASMLLSTDADMNRPACRLPVGTGSTFGTCTRSCSSSSMAPPDLISSIHRGLLPIATPWLVGVAWRHACERAMSRVIPGSGTRRWRVATRSGNQSGAQFSVQPGRRSHVGIDQTGVDVAFGLDHRGVGRRGDRIGRLVALVGQRQAFDWPRHTLGAARWRGCLPPDRLSCSRAQRHGAPPSARSARTLAAGPTLRSWPGSSPMGAGMGPSSGSVGGAPGSGTSGTSLLGRRGWWRWAIAAPSVSVGM